MTCKKLTEFDVIWEYSTLHHEDGTQAIVEVAASYQPGLVLDLTINADMKVVVADECPPSERLVDIRREVLARLQRRCDRIHKAMDVPIDRVWMVSRPFEMGATWMFSSQEKAERFSRKMDLSEEGGDIIEDFTIDD